ncbi:MAG: single-stranded-DNA-specific exonuclease RecJ [Nitrospinae bacterium]|nr:single-stranded-DNA-specific exonuclease RecJ [Nitrospinota bacterium]
MKTEWNLPKVDQMLCSILSREIDIEPLIAQIIINRGMTDSISARRFLDPSLKYLYDPFMMKDMDKGIRRIIDAIRGREKICIYGDYDVDGITATALLITFFREVGIDVSYYIPDRISEGYGLNIQAIKEIRGAGVSLIITVDCGISDIDEVEEAKGLEIDLIITDHHHVPDRLPDAVAILNPEQKDCPYPFKYLSGVGIAFKMIKGLRSALRKEKWFQGVLPNLKRHLDLVALGTIADIAPLVDENHILVKYGLKEITNNSKIGLRSLKVISGINEKDIDTYDVGFVLAPRLNATGRIGRGDMGVELLISEDISRAMDISRYIERVNRERQHIQEKILKEVKEIIEGGLTSKESSLPISRGTQAGDSIRPIVLASDKWHPGVIGIVASKIVDDYFTPTILISLDGERGRGSARSTPFFHIYDGLRECSDLLIDFGGHKSAAGLTIKKEKIEEFKERFNMVVKKGISNIDTIPIINIDAIVDLNALNKDVVKSIDSLGPFGHSNPQPILLAQGVRVIGEHSIIGKNGQHLKFKVLYGSRAIDVIGFNMSYMAEAQGLTPSFNPSDSRFDIVFTPQINRWNNSETLQLKLRDMRKTV